MALLYVALFPVNVLSGETEYGKELLTALNASGNEMKLNLIQLNTGIQSLLLWDHRFIWYKSRYGKGIGRELFRLFFV